jgi:FlaA1/EpsC-like NDP-sugar epimerase
MTTEQPWEGFLPSPATTIFVDNAAACTGKRILITGAGGHIGSALARSLAGLGIAQLLLLDIAEYGLYSLGLDFQHQLPAAAFELILGDVCDRSFFTEIFERGRPDIVFHAAALKHVPLLEGNPFAAAQTNVLGTRNVAELSVRFHVEQLLLLSTDKAVDPIGIMGATKRLAELIVRAQCGETQMKVIRLCNVLGASGSVAPLFARQIAAGCPVTVTHPEATRYFLSIEAATQFLMNAVSHDFYTGTAIPRVDKPSRIEALASFLMERDPQCEPGGCGIVYTGLRAGEKLHESMISSRETMCDTGKSSFIDVQSASLSLSNVNACLEQMEEAIHERNLALLLHAIYMAVPEYQPGEQLYSRGEILHRATR